MRLSGKTAVITGAGRGIGKAITEAFIKEGASVVLAARTSEEITLLAEQLSTSGAKAFAQTCDVTQEEQVKDLIQFAKDKFGAIHILVNNAGTGLMRPVWGTPKSGFERVIATNLTGTFLCTKHVWKQMQECGGGSIINISSLGGMEGYPLLTAYCASKWGQIGFTIACAEEGKPDRIRVNAIAPGKVDTALRAQIQEDKSRILQSGDIAGTSIFLASDESQYITGHVIPIDWFGPQAAES